MYQVLIKVKEDIKNNNHNSTVIKKTIDSKHISSIAWEIIDSNITEKFFNLFNKVIEFVYIQKKIISTLSEFDLFHLHISINKKNEIEFLFHLYEYPKNYYNPKKNSNLIVSVLQMKNRNVSYNLTTELFTILYNYSNNQIYTVSSESIGEWIGDIYLYNNKFHIFLLDKYIKSIKS